MAEPEITVFRPNRPGIRKVLGDLEAEIMELIWARAPAEGVTVRDIFEPLHRRRRLAYTTIMSTMARLARKGLLKIKKHGQAYVYFPAFTPAEFESRIVGRLLEDLLVSFSGPTVEFLEGLGDPAVAASARRLLEEIVGRRKMEKGK
jgi:predicted transcriptional regulator